MRVAAIVAAWVLAVAAPAAAQLREPVTAESEVDAAEPGQTIRVFGAGWERGSTVNLGIAAVLGVAAFLILRARRRALEPTGSV